MSCVSPSGKFLGYSPSEKVLEAFRKLPETERAPGAVKVPALGSDEHTVPAPPEGGLVLRVHARFLTNDDKGSPRYARSDDFPLMGKTAEQRRTWELFLHPNTEYMWLTAQESKALIPATPTPGQTVPVPAAIIDRLVRFHLTPRRATTSEGGILSKRDVKTAQMQLTVSQVTEKRLVLRLTGQVHTGTAFDADKATSPNGPLGFGFESPLHGIIEFDREKKAISRFDVIAPGSLWGRWGDANGKSLFAERPGRTPFAFALELASGQSPTDRIPPGGNGSYVTGKSGYFPSTP